MDAFNTTWEELEEFNIQSIQYRIPAMALLGIMIPFGIIGNAFVIFIYGFRLKANNVNLFITVLGVSDLISCSVGMPLEIYRLRFYYSFYSVIACKYEGFCTFAFYIWSMVMLLIISVERYVKVCRSTKTQVSRKAAKTLACSALIFSCAVSIPIPYFVTPILYTLENGVVVYQCHFHIEPIPWLYCNTFFIVLICVLVIMYILYKRVLKAAEEHVNWTLQRKARNSTNDPMDSAKAAKSKQLTQTNRAVMWISIVYATSCVPIFIIAIVTKVSTHLSAPHMVDAAEYFFLQSWILNCTFNPVVYGFLNSAFRLEFHKLLDAIFLHISLNSRQSNTSGSTGNV